MTPKEKAKELVCKMHNSENCGIKHFPNENFCDCVEINLFQSKQCALIAVNEISKAVESDWSFMERKQNFWQEVKSEIEKL